jgi:hypothetical protein
MVLITVRYRRGPWGARSRGEACTVRLAGSLWLVLICSERKVLLTGCCWLVCSDKQVLLVGD